MECEIRIDNIMCVWLESTYHIAEYTKLYVTDIYGHNVIIFIHLYTILMLQKIVFSQHFFDYRQLQFLTEPNVLFMSIKIR